MARNPVELPHRNDAYIDPAKLKDYALDPDHDLGRHKARVFKSALGITRDDWEYLRDRILEGVQTAPVVAVRTETSWGWGYEVRMDIEGLNGQTHPVITAWIVEGDAAPRLITLYVEVP